MEKLVLSSILILPRTASLKLVRWGRNFFVDSYDNMSEVLLSFFKNFTFFFYKTAEHTFGEYFKASMIKVSTRSDQTRGRLSLAQSENLHEKLIFEKNAKHVWETYFVREKECKCIVWWIQQIYAMCYHTFSQTPDRLSSVKLQKYFF